MHVTLGLPVSKRLGQYSYVAWHGTVEQNMRGLHHVFITRVIICVMSRLCGLVVRIAGYISKAPVQFPALPDFLRTSGSGTGSTQPCEYN
jgi:hypothetical protein